MYPRLVLLTSICLCLALLTNTAWSQEADTIFLGEHIITVDQARPKAQAVAIKGDRILAVGDTDEVLKHKGEGTRVINLGDRALLPGFIDTHGHFSMQISLLNMAQLSPPPVGTVTNIAELQAVLSGYIKEKAISYCPNLAPAEPIASLPPIPERAETMSLSVNTISGIIKTTAIIVRISINEVFPTLLPR